MSVGGRAGGPILRARRAAAAIRVGSLRTGAQPANRLRLARVHLHARSAERLAQVRAWPWSHQAANLHSRVTRRSFYWLWYKLLRAAVEAGAAGPGSVLAASLPLVQMVFVGTHNVRHLTGAPTSVVGVRPRPCGGD